jgi:hypothetical protein
LLAITRLIGCADHQPQPVCSALFGRYFNGKPTVSEAGEILARLRARFKPVGH